MKPHEESSPNVEQKESLRLVAWRPFDQPLQSFGVGGMKRLQALCSGSGLSQYDFQGRLPAEAKGWWGVCLVVLRVQDVCVLLGGRVVFSLNGTPVCFFRSPEMGGLEHTSEFVVHNEFDKVCEAHPCPPKALTFPWNKPPPQPRRARPIDQGQGSRLEFDALLLEEEEARKEAQREEAKALQAQREEEAAWRAASKPPPPFFDLLKSRKRQETEAPTTNRFFPTARAPSPHLLSTGVDGLDNFFSPFPNSGWSGKGYPPGVVVGIVPDLDTRFHLVRAAVTAARRDGHTLRIGSQVQRERSSNLPLIRDFWVGLDEAVNEGGLFIGLGPPPNPHQIATSLLWSEVLPALKKRTVRWGRNTTILFLLEGDPQSRALDHYASLWFNLLGDDSYLRLTCRPSRQVSVEGRVLNLKGGPGFEVESGEVDALDDLFDDWPTLGSL